MGWDNTIAWAGSGVAALTDSSWTNTGAGVRLFHDVTVNEQTDYVISAFVYNGLLGGGSAYIDLGDAGVLLPSGSISDCHGISTSPGTAQWEFVYCLFTTLAGQTSLSLRVVVDANIQAGSYAAFDEYALTLAGEFVPPLSLSDDQDGDGQSELEGDCDDTDPNNYDGNTEVCDGFDNDCDGAPGPGEADADVDGWMPCEGDCDDGNAAINPDAIEACNGLDDDCDSTIPADEADLDSDGFLVCQGDCDDTNAGIHPDAAEACNGLDDDCDGIIPPEEVDGDGDGVSECEGDCDDDEVTAVPGGTESCFDGIDNDCDGDIDGDDSDCDSGDDDDAADDDDDAAADDDDAAADDDDAAADDDDAAADDDDAAGDDDDAAGDDDDVDGPSFVADPDCGCASAPPRGAPAAGWLLLLAAVVGRRPGRQTKT
jgi:hypothetical protein